MVAPINLHPEAALSLTLAVISSSSTPLLLLNEELRVVAASASFCRDFGIDPASISGQELAKVGAGEWAAPQLMSLLEATASGAAEIEAYEMDLNRQGEPVCHLVIRAHKLDYSDKNQVLLVMAVADMTQAHADEKFKDDLVRQKDILLREVQHRVANSLQIIASVLMQSARKVQSEETRGHLHDAHHRVMSIAAVQKQLAASTLGEVELAPYLVQLCKSLSASMVHDHKQLSIEVEVDESVIDADVSVSLGLIVTELVINALKHAFPDHRHGTINVAYHSQGPNWTLSVSDDGMGMPENMEDAKPGLGTNIVEALAKRLEAKVAISNERPGTAVSVAHRQISVVDADVVLETA
ncbi:MAG: Signal transduction histidine kinase [Devosia sp.]|uniref:sensor histidine kinase n=1 Tax=Devosia sp. TaxID=1871048 RepID=UPI002607C074|nr:PAS domain-containing sensor histidine kinase [Devosia sp.]MDB5527398.1 Signal transduction histidine kinase [Devosia sp.]